jgi:hypothetical protein
MPLGTARWLDTTLLKVTGSFSTRKTSAWRNNDHHNDSLYATGRCSRISSNAASWSRCTTSDLTSQSGGGLGCITPPKNDRNGSLRLRYYSVF